MRTMMITGFIMMFLITPLSRAQSNLNQSIGKEDPKMLLKNGDQAPDFSLQDMNGVRHRLSDYEGKWVVLYFYPKDDTPGCTKEACEFRDDFQEFEKIGVTLIGVSTDTTESHALFSKKYGLPFILLSDPSKEVVEKYGAGGKASSTAKRMTFMINPAGKIDRIYDKVVPAEHSKELLLDLKNEMRKAS